MNSFCLGHRFHFSAIFISTCYHSNFPMLQKNVYTKMPVAIHKSRPDVLNLFILGCSINVTTGYTDSKICQHALQKLLLSFLHCLLQWSQINPFACIDMKAVPGIRLGGGGGRNRGGDHSHFQIHHCENKNTVALSSPRQNHGPRFLYTLLK